MDRGPILKYDAYLEHISGDYFLAVAYNTDSPEDPMYFRVEFKVNVAGRAEQLGLGLETEMDGLIWFDRND